MTVQDGEFVALVGRNGSGKSSLLHSIAGYHETVRGTIHAGGVRIDGLPTHRRSQYVALVEQGGGVGLPIHMSIGEILGLWTERHRSLFGILRWRQADAGLSQVLEEYLPSLANRLADQVVTLSGGERQLLSLACLKARLASVHCSGFAVLLDEHTASLDSVLADRVMKESQALVRQHQACGIAVTHQLDLASRFADRIVMLKDGRVFSALERDPTDDGGRGTMEARVRRLFME